MAVPAHDDRDYEFAKKFNIPIVQVLEEVTGTPHEGEKKKNSIVAIVYDKKNDKYLTINWGKNGGRLFIGGTRHDGESALECAKREIKEETGYVDLELICEDFKINHHYYAYNKDSYFNIEATPLLFELKSDKRENQQLDDDEDFSVEWVSKECVEEEIVEETDAFAPETTAAEVSEDIDTAAYSEPATVAISTTPVRKEMTWVGSKVWLKTNIPYWALVVANLGVEVRLSDHWSLDIPVMYSPYTIAPTYRFRIFAVQPSARYWLKPDMTGHFFGIHATGGMFNISVNDTQRFQDINGAWGGGIDYGYALKFSKHWGMEFNIGIGYLWSRYETFYNIENGVSYNEATLNYFGITRLGISLIYKL